MRLNKNKLEALRSCYNEQKRIFGFDAVNVALHYTSHHLVLLISIISIFNAILSRTKV
jgi:hypothetical protein